MTLDMKALAAELRDYEIGYRPHTVGKILAKAATAIETLLAEREATQVHEGGEPVAWQRRLRFDSQNMNLPGPWEQCGSAEALGHWGRHPLYEYRPLCAVNIPVIIS